VRRRLSLLVLAVTSMVVAAFVVPLGVLVRQQTESRALARGERTAQAVAAGLAVAASLSPDLSASLVDLVVATSGDGATSVFLPDRTVAGLPAAPSAAVEQARTGRALSADAAGGVEVLVPVTGPAGVLVVRTWVPGSELHEGVAAAWAVLGGLGLVLILAGVALADRMGAALVRPVAALAGAARRMAAGDLQARVEPAGPPEIADAGAAFNHLAARLDDLVAEERESLADLSHRLRTPLTALRLQAEGLPGGEALLEDVDRLGSQVDAVINEARRRSPAAGPRRADLCRVAVARAGFWQVLADEQGRRAHLTVPAGPVWVSLTEDELGAALDTLLENVFTHTPPGTAYAVAVTAPDPTHSLLVVEDEGPGFPHHGVAERGASEAGSSGLGLDIARRAARHTGGELTLADRPGGGARVEVRFGRHKG
jgi:signal transduction histidine kinase